MAPKKKPIAPNPIENYVKTIIDEVLDQRETKLKEEDAKQIIKAILPEIEKITSKIIIMHLKALATYVQENLKDPEEK
jgi:hypothetical protein